MNPFDFSTTVTISYLFWRMVIRIKDAVYRQACAIGSANRRCSAHRTLPPTPTPNRSPRDAFQWQIRFGEESAMNRTKQLDIFSFDYQKPFGTRETRQLKVVDPSQGIDDLLDIRHRGSEL